MRFTRHKQNTQTITYTVDLYDGSVVTRSEFAISLWDRKLQDVHAAMGQFNWDLDVLANGDRQADRRVTIHCN